MNKAMVYKTGKLGGNKEQKAFYSFRNLLVGLDLSLRKRGYAGLEKRIIHSQQYLREKKIAINVGGNKDAVEQ